MRLTRHARNRLRLYSVGQHEIEFVVRDGRPIGPDELGNWRIAGTVGDGREFVVVVALDNPNLVITLIEWSAR